MKFPPRQKKLIILMKLIPLISLISHKIVMQQI